MIFGLMLRGLRTGKARFACAVAGMALAVGSVVFMSSFVSTNRAQAPELARRASAPWAAWKVEGVALGRGGRSGTPPRPGGVSRPVSDEAPSSAGSRRPRLLGKPSPVDPHADLSLRLVSLEVDYRQDGRVLQGPPMMALVASSPPENPYGSLRLAEGRWVDEAAAEPEIVCVRSSLQRFGKGKEPPLGSEVVFVLRERRDRSGAPGRGQTKLTARVVGYLDGEKLPPMFPGVFANGAALASLPSDCFGTVSFYADAAQAGAGENVFTAESEAVVAGYTGDEQKRMDFATPLLLSAAVLTALALLVLSLLLSVESNRKTLTTLRTVGLTRAGVVRFVLCESLFAGLVGWTLGVGGALAALSLYVAADPVAFPTGAAFAWPRIRLTLVILPLVVGIAVLFALAPALRVRPMDASAGRPRTHRSGMAVTFALGFSAFVAVLVWGASLMRAFVPSPEWPDAIVSLLPGGVRATDATMAALRSVEGVRRMSELAPLQVQLADRERGRNALFLASEWLPAFTYTEGNPAEAEAAWREGRGVVITEIMSRALGLHCGDELAVETRGPHGGRVERHAFPIVGVTDLNWHMVTSRGLVRGLNGASPMTDGPVFASFDLLGELDPFANMVGPSPDPSDPEALGDGEKPMTHLWVEYEPDFLAKHGAFGAGRRVEAEIGRRLGGLRNSTVRLHARDEIADGTMAHGDELIGQAARIPFFFLVVLSLGFVAMLVSEADASRPAFAVLRAVGATRAQLAWRLTRSALRTALVGIAIGVPVGSLVGWLATFKTGNWPGLPHWFVLPVGVVAEGALGAVLFALVFAVPTALVLINRATKR